MKYLEDKRRRLQGQQTGQAGQAGQTVQTQPVKTVQKPAAVQIRSASGPVQKQQAAPSPVESQTMAQAPARKQSAAPMSVQSAPAPGQNTGSDVVEQAQQYLDQQLSGYQSRYGAQITDLVAQLQNRPAFEYDVNTDPLYLQLRDTWKQDGLMAMEDTMGQAAQLTGGYGNSHAQMAGQQVYNSYLRQVNEMVPQLKEAARADYDADTDALLRNLGLLMDQDSTDYARWMDELNRQYQMDRDALSDERYEQEWEYQTGRDALADQRYQDELAYGREQDQYARQQQSYDRLLELIIATGYKPTAEELAAAGMTEAEAQAWLGYYDKTVGGSSGSGAGSGTGGRGNSGGGDGGGDGDPKPIVTLEDVEEHLKVLAGNGANKGVLLEYINETYKDGDITKEDRDRLAEWAKSLIQPGAGSQTGGRGNGSSGIGSDFRVIDHG